MNIKKLHTALLLLGTISSGQQLFCAAESDLQAALRASMASEAQEKRNQRDLEEGMQASRLRAEAEEKEMAAVLEASRQSAAREAEARQREQARLRQQSSAGHQKKPVAHQPAPAQAEPRRQHPVAAHAAPAQDNRVEACCTCQVERAYTGNKNMFITDNINRCTVCDNNTFIVIESQAAQRQEPGLSRAELAALNVHVALEPQQEGATCGLYAMANAATFNQVLNQSIRVPGKKLDLASVETAYQSAAMKHNVENATRWCQRTIKPGSARMRPEDNLNAGNLESLARELDIQNITIIEGANGLLQASEIINRAIHHIQRIKQPMAQHFVCNLTGGHWTLISLVRPKPNANIDIFYVDSITKSRENIDKPSLAPYLRHIGTQLGLLK
jgi:hypothetical protein